MLKVKLEKPRAIKDDPEAIRKWERSAPVAMAATLAEEIRRRVQDRGELTRSYSPGDFEPVYVSPRYPGAAGKGRESGTGAVVFKDKDAMRAALGIKPNRFSPSGGMWGGLSVVSRGGRAAEDLFRGRSEGQDPGFFRYASGKIKARGRKVSNALKAWTVLEATGINILELRDDELTALEHELTAQLAQATEMTLGMDAKLPGSTSRHPVATTLRRLMQGR